MESLLFQYALLEVLVAGSLPYGNAYSEQVRSTGRWHQLFLYYLTIYAVCCAVVQSMLYMHRDYALCLVTASTPTWNRFRYRTFLAKVFVAKLLPYGTSYRVILFKNSFLRTITHTNRQCLNHVGIHLRNVRLSVNLGENQNLVSNMLR